MKVIERRKIEKKKKQILKFEDFLEKLKETAIEKKEGQGIRIGGEDNPGGARIHKHGDLEPCNDQCI